MRIRKNTNVSLQLLAAAVEYSDPSLAQRMCPVNQSPWDAVFPVQVNQPIFTENGNTSLADSIGVQVNQPGIFTANGNTSFADSIEAQVNQPGTFTASGNTTFADSIGAQVNQPTIFTKDGNTSLADSIGVQQRGASKENPILLDDEENENGDENVDGDGNKNGDGTGNGNGDENGDKNGNGDGNENEDKSEYVEIPLLVVFGNKKRPTVSCETKSMRPIKGSFALCKCHGQQPLCKCHRPKPINGKTKTLNLLPVKKIYKPRAIKPAHAYGDDGFYYYSGFAPSKRGGSTSKDSGEDSDVFDLN